MADFEDCELSMTAAECAQYMQANAVEKEINFKLVNILNGLLHLWHAVYGFLFFYSE